MSEAKTDSFLNTHGNLLIIATAIALVVIVGVVFMDRQQARDVEMLRIDRQMDVMEEWSPPNPNRQPANPREGRRL